MKIYLEMFQEMMIKAINKIFITITKMRIMSWIFGVEKVVLNWMVIAISAKQKHKKAKKAITI